MDIPNANKSSISLFNLSQTIPLHKAAVRSIACNNNGVVVSTSLDGTCAIFNSNKDDNNNGDILKLLRKTNFHDGPVYCVEADKLDKGFFTAGKDKRIIYMDCIGNPLIELLDGHTNIICSLSHNRNFPNILVSGSWDTTAVIWDINKGASICTLSGHSHAVTVLELDDGKIITGSQDKALNFWSSSGTLIKKIENAHEDIIRSIIISPSKNSILTASNDMAIKEWSFDGNLINKFQAHEAFIFGLANNTSNNNMFFSCGDDKVVNVWDKNYKLMQKIRHPNTVWDVQWNSLTNDIVTACSDCIIRVFSQQKGKWLPETSLKEYETLCDAAEMQNENNDGDNVNNDIDLNKLPNVTDIVNIKNAKEGEVRIFNNKGVGEAYTYTVKEGWKLIGEVMGKKNTKKYYEGDRVFKKGEYDYIFDVDIGGGSMALLPFNEGDNVLIAAERFVTREKLHKMYIDDIRKFLNENTGRGKNKNKNKNNNRNKSNNNNNDNDGNISTKNFSFPIHQIQIYDKFNAEGAMKKITSLNLSSSPSLVSSLTQTLGNQNYFHSSSISDEEINEISKIIKNNKGDNLIPIFDILRIMALHPMGYKFFCDNNNDKLGIIIENAKDNENKNIKILAIRTLCNLFNSSSTRSLLLGNNISKIFSLISSLRTTPYPQLFDSLINLIYNYSTNLIDADISLQNNISEILSSFLPLISNEESGILALKSIGNLISGGKVKNILNNKELLDGIKRISEKFNSQENVKELVELFERLAK